MGGCESAPKPAERAGASPAREASQNPAAATSPARAMRRALIVKQLQGQEANAVRAEPGTANGKRVIKAVEPEDVQITLRMNEDGDGVMKGDGWEVTLQFINIGAREADRIIDICREGKRNTQLRITSQGPIAVGYPEPFPSEDSKISYPDKGDGRPYFWTKPPEQVGGDPVRAFQQGMFNVFEEHGGQDILCATVRSQLDRSIAVQIVRDMDPAIAIAFVVARTWLE